MAVLKGHADKRTEEQRRNDTAQKARPKGVQDKATVSTGPTPGMADERKDKPAAPTPEDVPVTVVPSKPAGGITGDDDHGPGVQ